MTAWLRRLRDWLVADDPHPEPSRLDQLDMRSWPHRQEHSTFWLGPDPAAIDPPYVDEVDEVDRFMAALQENGDWTDEDNAELDRILGRWVDKRAGR